MASIAPAAPNRCPVADFVDDMVTRDAAAPQPAGDIFDTLPDDRRDLAKRIAALGPEAGFILDGFPRTRDQANILDETLAEKSRGLDQALFIRVPEEELVRRLSGRFVCRQGQAHHALSEADPGVSYACQRCGGELYQREDDRAEAVQARIEVYHRQTAPVLDYYRAQGLLAEVSGVGAIEDINRLVLAALELPAPGTPGNKAP